MKKLFFFIIGFTVSMLLFAWENNDWLTEYNWAVEDGRDLVTPGAEHIYFHRDQIPNVEFHKFEIPSNSALFQARLRTERFYFLFQTKANENRYNIIGRTFETAPFDIIFRENFSRISITRGNAPWGSRDRVGQQTDPNHPLVGIWGRLPALTEYRLVNPVDVIYYFEIDRAIPVWAVREGTYLIRQTGNNTFETVTSFPDGHLRLEILNETTILMTPLFSLPNESGLTAPLALRRRLRL